MSQKEVRILRCCIVPVLFDSLTNSIWVLIPIIFHRKVDRVLHDRNVVFHCISKKKLSAAYNQHATANIISTVKEGKLLDDTTCEAFIGGVRIAGGDRSNFPDFRDGLLEQLEPKPLFHQCNRRGRSYGGCRAQCQGRGAFIGWQTIVRWHQMECKDKRKVEICRSCFIFNIYYS